jgi:hypothetical protein
MSYIKKSFLPLNVKLFFSFLINYKDFSECEFKD